MLRSSLAFLLLCLAPGCSCGDDSADDDDDDSAGLDAGADAPAGPDSGQDAAAATDAGEDAATDPDAGPDPDPSDAVFTTDVLHQIELEIGEEYYQQLDQDHENRVPATITFDGERIENIGIRERCGIGSCTSIYDKAGFSIRFDEFEEGLSLQGLDRLNLANEIQDTSYSNRFLANQLARRAGLPWKRTSWAEVTLDGQPYGLFLVLEAVEKQYLERWFGDGDDEGNLYEGECCGDFVWNPYHPQLKDEEEGRTRDDIIVLADFIASQPDDEFAAGIDDRMDFAGYLRGYAISAFTYHWDGYEYNTNNYYMYHRPSDDRFVFWLHGEDQLFYDCGWPIDWFGPGRIGQRVQEIPELRDAFHAELRRLVEEVWIAEELVARLDEVVDVYGDAARNDPTRPLDQGRLDAVRQCLLDRGANVLAQLDAVCGNGVLEAGEQCDDGGTERGDGCSPTCRSECGNGVLDGDEQCDDGNFWEGDGCSPLCTVEPGCGDGIVQDVLGETCDDGRNGDAGDGCRDDCLIPLCGDGALDVGEGCDDGAQVDFDGCSALCADEDGLPTCGNAIREVGEDCDDGNVLDGDGCDSVCLRPCAGGDGNLVWGPNGHCYQVFWWGADWWTAEQECEAREGHLVTVGTEAENRLLRDLGLGWIGLSDEAEEGSFAWVTGEPYTFDGFRPGEPNDWGGNEDCAILDSATWNDLDCAAAASFLCEID